MINFIDHRSTHGRVVPLREAEVGLHWTDDLDDAHGGGAALPMAVEYLRGEVAPLLHGRYNDAVGRALFSATAEFTLSVG